MDSLDIIPVADPTTSSEAHKYAKSQALMQSVTVQGVNVPAILLRYFKELEIDKYEELVIPPEQQQKPPDPKMIDIQLKHQREMAKLELAKVAEDRARQELQIKALKTQIERMETQLKVQESSAKIGKMQADAAKDRIETSLALKQVQQQDEKLDIERDRIRVMEKSADNKKSSG